MLVSAKNRYTAFGMHLAVSGILFIALSVIIVFWWYPGFLFTAEGGWQGIRLIAGVDLVAGPLLTLMVYKPGKRGMAFDLGCIGILQTSCLIIGMLIVNHFKPIAVVYAAGEFFTMTADTYKTNLNMDIKSIPLLAERDGVAWIYTAIPDAETSSPGARIQAEKQNGTFHTRVAQYQPLSTNLKHLRGKGLMRDRLTKEGYHLENFGNNIEFFHLYSKYYLDGAPLAIDTDSGKLLGVMEKQAQ